MRVVFDIDDLCDDFDPLRDLDDLKKRLPNLKVTVFAIPSRCSAELLEDYRSRKWIEIGVHGYHHSSMECATWTYEEARSKLEELEHLGWAKIFKAPGWQMSPGLYEALHELDWLVAEHAAYSAPLSGTIDLRRYCYNLPDPDIRAVHGHTWNTMRNGPDDWDQLFDGIGREVEFYFVSEVAERWSWEYGEQDENQVGSGSGPNATTRYGAIAATFMRKWLDENPECSVADFGGNDGTAASVDRSRVTNIEGDPELARDSDMRGVRTICCDLRSIPVPDNFYDIGFCSHVLEHFPDGEFEKVWNEIRRVTKGPILVSLPVEDDEKFAADRAHYQQHTHEEWLERLGLEEWRRLEDGIVGVYRP